MLDDSGAVVPLVPDTVVGVYTARVLIRPGAAYDLSGTIDGAPVGAHTEVPDHFTILVPAGDTISATDTLGCRSYHPTDSYCVPVVLDFDGSPPFVYEAVGGGYLLSRDLVPAYTGDLILPKAVGASRVDVIAFNDDAADWLMRRTPRGNVTGAFGGFGAVLVARREIGIP